jgi:hypothetical protein
VIHPLPHHPDFRKPAGVGQKTRNVVDQHPDHSGSRSNGSRLDKEVLDEFLADPARMRAMAARMREQLAVGLASSPVGVVFPPPSLRLARRTRKLSQAPRRLSDSRSTSIQLWLSGAYEGMRILRTSWRRPCERLAMFVGPEADALIFPGAQGGPLRRSNFNKMSAWPHAARTIGARGMHFHDLRHTGNHFAAASGASLKDLMARMGHDSERAAIIYQHAARGADQAIAEAMDAHVEAQQTDGERGDDGASGVPMPAG